MEGKKPGAENRELTLLYPQRQGKDKARKRLDTVLSYALEGLPVRSFEDMGELFEDREAAEGLCGRRLLFAVPLGDDGINHGYYELLSRLRAKETRGILSGCTAGILIDADSELYTKATARELAAAANRAGCAFFGRPLTEGTASLDNFLVQAANWKTDRLGAYKKSARMLAEQVLTASWEKKAHPRLLALHASNHKTSNTMALWKRVRERLDGVEIRELNLRNGSLEDCSGCPYQMCLHFGERGQCFYGGAMVEDVYPAVKWADGLLLLCPNYNDALSANLTAFINRLTALFRTMRFYDKAVFAIIVSGYSGSDLLAEQLIGALNMNKTFYLPGNFCMLETGNTPGSALESPGIEKRLEEFAAMVRETLLERG